MALLFPGGVKGRNFFVHEAAKAAAKGFVIGIEQGTWNHDCHLSDVEESIYTERLLGESLY
jgi:hypothetical protein